MTTDVLTEIASAVASAASLLQTADTHIQKASLQEPVSKNCVCDRQLLQGSQYVRIYGFYYDFSQKLTELGFPDIRTSRFYGFWAHLDL